MHGQLEEHSPHQKRPRLQHADRIIAQLPARTEAVIHCHAHRARDTRDQRHWRHGKRRQVAVRGQQNHAEQRQHDAHDLIRARLSVRSRAGDQQHHHRRQILHDRADGRVGKLNGQKIKKLAQADAENAIEHEHHRAIPLPPRGEQQPPGLHQPVDKQNQARQAQTDRDQPRGLHGLVRKQILPHRAGNAPAHTAARRHQRTLELSAHRKHRPRSPPEYALL